MPSRRRNGRRSTATRALVEYDLRPGGALQRARHAEMKCVRPSRRRRRRRSRGSDPPRKLVQTYRFLFSDANKAEGFTRVTWEIEKVAVRLLAADRDPRARGRADHGRHGGEQVLRAGRGRLGLDSERPEVAARDRELDVGPTSREGRSSHVGSSLWSTRCRGWLEIGCRQRVAQALGKSRQRRKRQVRLVI